MILGVILNLAYIQSYFHVPKKREIQNAHYSKVNVYLHRHMQSCVKNVFRLKIAHQVGGKGVLNRFQHKPNNPL